jgi:signal transduction histidine kinase/ligand-binding sensor domain-containing protein
VILSLRSIYPSRKVTRPPRRLGLIVLILLSAVISQPTRSDSATLKPIGFASPVFTSTGPPISPFSLVTADFNQDGIPDVASGDSGASASVFLGRGDGTLHPPASYPAESHASHFLQATDLDHDGITDLIATPSTRGSLMTILRGQTNGSFQLQIGPVIPDNNWGALLGDWNADGFPDLAVPDPYDKTVGVSWGTHGVSFHPFPGPIHEGLMRLHCPADFNRDGLLDAAWSSPYQNQVAITLGTPGGLPTFHPKRISLTRPGAMTCGDFDEDGSPDLAVVHLNEDALSILRGRGDGTFDSPQKVAIGNLPSALTTGDFNRDGHTDLAVALWQGCELGLLLGRGNGTFEGPYPFEGILFPTDIAAADLNRDGSLDLILCSRDIHGIAVILAKAGDPNQSPKLPAERHPLIRDDAGRRDYQIDSWSTSEGLPRNEITCLCQTRNGYVWVGTANGLARFDGRRFRVFDSASTPSLTDDNCRAMAEGPDGTLWVATARGIASVQDDRIDYTQIIEKQDSFYIRRVLPDRDGTLWFTEAARLRHAPTTDLTAGSAALDAMTDVHRIAFDSQFGLLIQRSHVLVRKPSGSDALLPLFSAPRPGERSLPGMDLFEDSQKRVWFSQFSNLCVWETNQVRIYGTEEGGWSWGSQLCLGGSSSGDLWVGSDDSGVFRIRDQRITAIPITDGARTIPVTCIQAGLDGQIWIGTRDSGLKRLRPRPLITYTTEDGLPNNDVYSILETQDGSVWVGTGYGVARFANGKFDSFQAGYEHQGHAVDRALALGEDDEDRIWLRTPASLNRIVGNTYLPASPIPIHHLGEATALHRDSQGALWLTAVHYLARWHRNEWTLRSVGTTPTSYPRLLGVLPLSESDIWVGSYDSGVYHLVGTNEVHLTQADGLPSNFIAPVLADPDGTIWFASDNGLGRWNQGRIHRFTTHEGLPENIVLNVLDDGLGHLWINGHQGIHRLTRQSLDAVGEGRAKSIDVITFNTRDGMRSAEGNGGNLPNSCRTRDGKLWFPTTQGVVVIDPSAVATSDHAPRVRVGPILANDQPQASDYHWVPSSGTSITHDLHFPPGSARHLEIPFTDIASPIPQRIRFQYRLDGKDSEWREAQEDLRASYFDLPPGDYRFHLRVRSQRGTWHEVGHTLAFHLEPFLYQQTGFRVACALAAAAVLLGVHGYRLRLQRQILRLEHDARWTQERERISRDLHDDLGASLSRIALLGEVARKQLETGVAPAHSIDEITRIAGQSVDDMGELIWSNNPCYDTWDSLIAYLREHASRTFAGTPIECVQTFPEAPPSSPLAGEWRRHLFLLVKEALHNILKHAQATRVDIRFELTPNQLLVDIRDNGRGFDPEQVPAFHHGLQHLRQRIQVLHGTLILETQPGQGTRVKWSVPLPQPVAHPSPT